MALTVGEHIYFAPGRYNALSRDGLMLLGHELAHVVQQRAGRVVNPWGRGLAIVQDPRLEKEARDMALRLAQAADPITGSRGRVPASPDEITSSKTGSATKEPTVPAISRVLDVAQPSTYTRKLERKRARTTNRLLVRASERDKAFQATAVIYHNGQRIESFPFVDVRDGDLTHKYSHFYGNETDYDNEIYTIEKDEDWTSRDGEMFLLEAIVPYLDRYLKGLAASSETIDGDSGRLRSGSAPPTTPFGQGAPYPQLRDLDDNMHIIEIEFIGPKGTCINCQSALERYKIDLVKAYPKTRTETPIIIKITTRNTEEYHKKYVHHFEKRYGSDYAREVIRLGPRSQWHVVPHWELRIGEEVPFWVAKRHQRNIRRMRERRKIRSQNFMKYRKSKL
jgi:hypothetical protein